MSKRFVKIIPIFKFINPPSTKCQHCNEKATHCIIMPSQVFSCCSKQDCIYHLTQNKKGGQDGKIRD